MPNDCPRFFVFICMFELLCCTVVFNSWAIPPDTGLATCGCPWATMDIHNLDIHNLEICRHPFYNAL